MRLADRCFAVTGLGYLPPWTVNAGFITGDETTLIVDTGANSAAASTIHGYASTARPSNRLRVIDTERHFDHIGGNAFFRELGIDIYGHSSIQRSDEEFRAEKSGVQRLRFRMRHAFARKQEATSSIMGRYLANPNYPVTEDSRMDLGNCEIEICSRPATRLAISRSTFLRTEFCIRAIAW